MKYPLFVRTAIGVSMSMLIASCAFADHRHRHYHDDDDDRRVTYAETDYGDVIEARPIYTQVAVDVPRERCHVETVAREERHHNGDSFAGTVVGGLVGAAIGHELGNGRGGATAVGGLIGASIGNETGASREVHYRDEEVCRSSYQTQYEQRIVGYDVSYSYQGRIYQTRTNQHPGDRIALNVNVSPR